MNLLDKKIKNLTFEEAFERLNRVVDLIDDGNISLDDSIKYYEIGILLKDQCEQKLKDAELKIKKVVENKIEKIDEDDLQ
jgi:exodeoxyribonuclease VII small subunit